MEIGQCNHPTRDAGKVCSDPSECEPDCIFQEKQPSSYFKNNDICPQLIKQGCKDWMCQNFCQQGFPVVKGKGTCFGMSVTLGTCSYVVRKVKIGGTLLCVD